VQQFYEVNDSLQVVYVLRHDDNKTIWRPSGARGISMIMRLRGALSLRPSQ
jgi:hypothetical protein